MKKALVVLALGLLTSISAHAAETYVGGALGISFYNDKTDEMANDLVNSGLSDPGTTVTVKQDAAEAGARVFAGSWFTDNVGVEIGYAYLGEVESKINLISSGVPVSGDYKQTNQAEYLDLLIGGKVSNSVRLYGKLGGYYANSSGKLTASALGNSASTSDSSNNGGVHIGIGVDYAVLTHLDIKAAVEYFPNVGDNDKTEKYSVGLVTVGAAYRF